MSQVNIKKDFAELYALLKANENKKVSTIMDSILELISKRSAGGSNGNTFIKNDEGAVTHVFCYYHKKWEPVAEVEYGSKANTATGLNTMCKEGVSQWTKTQRNIKVQKSKLLERFLASELTQDELTIESDAIDKQAKTIVPHSSGLGFDKVEDFT